MESFRVAVLDVHVLPLDLLLDEIDDGLHGNAAGDFAGVVAAHAVSQHQQADVGIDCDGVLVVLADLTRIGQTNAAELVAQAHTVS